MKSKRRKINDIGYPGGLNNTITDLRTKKNPFWEESENKYYMDLLFSGWPFRKGDEEDLEAALDKDNLEYIRNYDRTTRNN